MTVQETHQPQEMRNVSPADAQAVQVVVIFMQEFTPELPEILARYRGYDLDVVMAMVVEQLRRIRNEPGGGSKHSLIWSAQMFRDRNPNIIETLDGFHKKGMLNFQGWPE